MKRLMAALLVCVFLTGCGSASMSQPMERLREELKQHGCSFTVVLEVDFGDTVNHFSLKCVAEQNGSLNFTVTEPQTIQGISGSINSKEGKLTYDDVILGFPLLAQGEISPVSTPWLLCRCLSGGYIQSYSRDDLGIRVTMDDVFRGEDFRMDVWLNGQGNPVYAEVFWEGQRIVSMEIDDFVML